MAHVYKRGKKWYGSWKDHTGNRVRRVLPGVTTKREAQEIANAFETNGTRVRAGVASDLDNSAGVAPLVEGFLLHKLATSSYETARFYRTALAGTLGRFDTPDGKTWPPPRPAPLEEIRRQRRSFTVGPLGAHSVDEITSDLIEQYVEANRDKLSTRTLNLRVAAVKALLTWARKGRKIKSNPIADQSRVGKPRVACRALSNDEVARLLVASPEPDRSIWFAFLTTGMRRGELVKLRWPEVDFGTNTIRVFASTSKSKAQREIPMVPQLRDRLMAMEGEAADPEGPVFANRDGRAWNNNLDRRFKRCLRRAGIDPSDVSLHTLRHTFATALILAGANIVPVSKLLGHATVTLTLNTYAHALPDNLREAIGHLPFGVTIETQGPKGSLQLMA